MGMPYRMSGIFSAFFVLSHSFPKAWYKEKAFQQQRKYLFAVFMAEEGIHMAYFGLELAFVHVPPTYQWILALLLIPMQEMLTRSYSWLCDKALGYEDVSSELVASNFVMTFQAMFMSIVLGTSATPASSYILFVVAVLQFLVDTLKVVEHIGKYCSSQPSMVHWLSSSIFPFCSFGRCPAMVTSDQISNSTSPRPPNPYIF